MMLFAQLVDLVVAPAKPDANLNVTGFTVDGADLTKVTIELENRKREREEEHVEATKEARVDVLIDHNVDVFA